MSSSSSNDGDHINLKPLSSDKEGEETLELLKDSHDLYDEDFEANPTPWWSQLCPWLLKWKWFRRLQYKQRNGSKKRLQWDNRVQYILTLVGYAVGLGNLWRFSFLVAKNGGATFVIPYLVMLFVVGIPLFYLESTIGQSLQRGPIKAWYKICPNLWGIGLSGVVLSVLIRVYYNVLIGWIILYFFHSFQNPLPWSTCGGYQVNPKYADNMDFLNTAVNDSHYQELLSCINDSAKYYWYNDALESSTSVNHFGGLNWRLMLCYIASWIIVYLCVFRGIKSSGKVVYFTATFPYLVMIIVFFRAVTLEGAGTGLRFLFIPEDESYLDILKPQVWLEAASQVFFSLGLSQGTIIALSSYSKQTNNNLVDSLIVCFTNSFTSLFVSIIVFSIVGFKATKLGTHPQLVLQGPSLAFIVISEAITLMPVPQLWTVLFFIMLFLLGLDSHFGGLEVLITVLFDNKKIRKYRRELIIGIVCLVMIGFSLPFTLGNGFYLFQLIDQYVGTLPLVIIGLSEICTISLILGVNRFFGFVKYPVHSYLKKFWWFVWTFVSPVAMMLILSSSVVYELIEPLKYTVFIHAKHYDLITKSNQVIRVEKRLPFPDWAQFIGSLTIICTLSCIPAVLLWRLITLKRARQQMIDFWSLTKERAVWVWRKITEFVFKDHDDKASDPPAEQHVTGDREDSRGMSPSRPPHTSSTTPSTFPDTIDDDCSSSDDASAPILN